MEIIEPDLPGSSETMPASQHRDKRFLADEHELQVVKRGSPRADDGEV